MSFCKHKTNDDIEVEVPCTVKDSRGIWFLDKDIFGHWNKDSIKDKAEWDKDCSLNLYRYKIRKFKGFYWIYCQNCELICCVSCGEIIDELDFITPEKGIEYLCPDCFSNLDFEDQQILEEKKE